MSIDLVQVKQAVQKLVPAETMSQATAVRLLMLHQLWQEHRLHVDLLYDSERGTAKSTELDFIMHLYSVHLNALGVRPVRWLVIRRYYDELSQEAQRYVHFRGHELTHEVAQKGYNKKDFQYNEPGGAYSIEWKAFEQSVDADKLIGKSYHGIRVEELTFVPPGVVATARKTLRAVGPNGEDLTMLFASTNPWGPFAGPWRKYYDIDNHPPVEFDDDENKQPVFAKKLNLFRDPGNRLVMRVTPKIWQNPWISKEYVQELASEPDQSKRAAHLFGIWRTSGGNMLDGVFGEHNLIHPWHYVDPDAWAITGCYDHGTTEAYYFGAIATALYDTRDCNGWFFPRGSKVLFLESENADTEQPNLADFPATVEQIADAIIQQCKPYGLTHLDRRGHDILNIPVIADSAMWNDVGISSVANEMRLAGIPKLRPSAKPPLRTRFPFVANLMRNAKAKDDDRIGNPPGFYVTRNCSRFLHCAGSLMRNPNDPEVWLSGGKEGSYDHPFDALCYGLIGRRGGFKVTDMSQLG